jgi:hypothetical protein
VNIKEKAMACLVDEKQYDEYNEALFYGRFGAPGRKQSGIIMMVRII